MIGILEFEPGVKRTRPEDVAAIANGPLVVLTPLAVSLAASLGFLTPWLRHRDPVPRWVDREAAARGAAIRARLRRRLSLYN
jgi:hypothetical protein